MITNNDNPLFVNFYHEIDSHSSINRGNVFVGQILSKFFIDIFSQICELLNVQIILTEEQKYKICNGHQCDISIYNKHVYGHIGRDKHHYFIDCKTWNHRDLLPKYRNLIYSDYVYLQVLVQNASFTNNEKLNFVNKIQKLLLNYDAEPAVCIL